MLVRVPPAPVLIQLRAVPPGKGADEGPGAWAPVVPLGDPDGVSSSGFHVAACNHLRKSQSADLKSLSLSICCVIFD